MTFKKKTHPREQVTNGAEHHDTFICSERKVGGNFKLMIGHCMNLTEMLNSSS